MTTNPQNRLPSNPTKIKNLLSQVGEELLLDEDFVQEIEHLGDEGTRILAAFGITQATVKKAISNFRSLKTTRN